MDWKVASSKLFSIRLPLPAEEREHTLSPFQAVAIRSKGKCCQAAVEARGRRYLCADAPRLPLAHCDRPKQCECQYTRHDDRRRGPRRTDDTGTFSRPPEQGPDQRKLGSRRAEDRETKSELASSLDDTYYDYVANVEKDLRR
jgi:hypothetical protein